MAAFSKGRVRTQSGSATIRAVYEAGLVNLSGTPYQVGEALSWSGGAGVVASWDAVTEEIGFTRTSGAAPAVGATLTGGTSGATGDIDGYGAASPPGFDTALSAGDFFRVKGHGAEFQIAGSIAADAFDLAAPFPDSNESVKYAVQTDTSADRGYPLVGLGDPDPITPLRRFQAQVDGDVERALAPLVETVTSGRTLDAEDDRGIVVLADASGSGYAVTLPDNASAGAGYTATVKAIDVSGGNVLVAVSGSDTLDGAGSVNLTSQHERITVVADGAGGWHRID